MAYIIGLVSKKEKKILEARGWDMEAPPKELGRTSRNGEEMVSVFVDSDLFAIMSGPDWDKSIAKQGKEGGKNS